MRLLKLNFKCVCLSVCARTLPIFFLILCDLEFSTAESHLYPAAPWDARCQGSSPLLLFFYWAWRDKNSIHSSSPSLFLSGGGRDHFDWRFAGLCNHRQRCMLMIYDFALFLPRASWLPGCSGTTLSLRRFLFIRKIKHSNSQSRLGSHRPIELFYIIHADSCHS